jgi:hypothetical protein
MTAPTPLPEASVTPVDAGSQVSCADPAPGGELGDVPPGADAPATAITEGNILDPQTGAKLARYALSAPKTFAPPGTTDPTKQLGLFIAFHEHGGAARDEVPTVIESLARLELSGDYVVIGMGQGDETTHGYTKVVDHQIALKLIDWAKKTYPINPRRVYYWGRGEGATMAQELGTEHPDLVTALITYSWGSKALPKVMNPTLKRSRFLHGDRARRLRHASGLGARCVRRGQDARVQRHLSRDPGIGRRHPQPSQQR